MECRERQTWVEKSSTRRGLLSMLSSVYNPLALGAPFILKRRRIIPQLCQEKLQWDEKKVSISEA